MAALGRYRLNEAVRPGELERAIRAHHFPVPGERAEGVDGVGEIGVDPGKRPSLDDAPAFARAGDRVGRGPVLHRIVYRAGHHFSDRNVSGVGPQDARAPGCGVVPGPALNDPHVLEDPTRRDGPEDPAAEPELALWLPSKDDPHDLDCPSLGIGGYRFSPYKEAGHGRDTDQRGRSASWMAWRQSRRLPGLSGNAFRMRSRRFSAGAC